MDASAIGIALFAVGVCGFVGWMLTRWIAALRAERATQEPSSRSPIALVLAIAAVIVIAAIQYFDDPRAGIRIGLAGLAILAVGSAIRRGHRAK